MYITVWDSDPQNQLIPFDTVDEFNFTYSRPAGQKHYDCYDGVRNKPKSRYCYFYHLALLQTVISFRLLELCFEAFCC